MAEETAIPPGFDPGRCVLAFAWDSRSSGVSSDGCPFRACIFLLPSRIPSGTERSVSVLRSIHDDGCRIWRVYSALAIEE